MTKREMLVAALLALVALVALAGAADRATAKGAGSLGSFDGVAVAGSPYRYIAMRPGDSRNLTVVARVDRDGGGLNRWWYLNGSFQVPGVAYDGSAGGLSADGEVLVLSRVSEGSSPRRSRFAVLDIQRSFGWSRPGHPHRVRRFFDYIDLRGDFSFDAISPDGSTVYLIERYLPPSAGPAYISNYKVRALDVASGRLLPEPIVDPDEPDERMAGLPITRATSPDGRWAYTLYDGDGEEPFVHALDTVGRRAVCIDLPQLADLRDLFMLKLRTDLDGETLTVMSAPPPPRRLPPLSKGRPIDPPTPRPLLHVDTASFEVSAADGQEGGAPEKSDALWPPAGIGLLVLASALGWERRSRRRRAHVPGAGTR